jgi:hypothetical protein
MATSVDSKIEKLIDKVEKVVQEQKEIKQTEKVILETVKETEKEDEVIEQEVETKSLAAMQRTIIQKVSTHKVLYPLIIMVGVVLVWRGMWGLFDVTPGLSYYGVSLVSGILILILFNSIKSL